MLVETSLSSATSTDHSLMSSDRRSQVVLSLPLTLYEGGKPTRTFSLNKPVVTLGRLPESDVIVPDAGASRQHARIANANGEYVLTDLGSTNGTLVNDEVVQERVLEDGDHITIGETVLR